MLCSNYARESGIKLEHPTARDLENVEEAAVSVAITQDGTVHVEGVKIRDNDPKAVEWAVLSRIKDKKTLKGRTVLFKCDKRVDKSVFEPILNAIAEAGARITAVGEEIEK